MHLKYPVLLFFCFQCLSPLELKSTGIESVIGFGDSLFRSRQYEKALHEYQRAFFFSKNTRKSILGEKIAACHIAMENFKLARDYYDSAKCYTASRQLRTDLEFQKIRCYMMEDQFGVALLRLNELEADTGRDFQGRRHLYQGICCFGTGQFDAMREHFMKCIPATDTLRISQLRTFYEQSRLLYRPSPALAMILSIVLPGAGQVYAGDVKEGLNSLVLLGGLVYTGTSGILSVPYVAVPFIQRYYLGGIMHAKALAESRREKNRYEYFLDLSHLLPEGESFCHLFEPDTQERFYPVHLRSADSELKILFNLAYLGYKEFLSSQDVDACVFHPSCSNYAIEAIDKGGVVTGLLDGFDRLSRCHPFVRKDDYPLDKGTMKYHDPPGN